MTIDEFGRGRWVRGTLLPEWLLGGGRHRASALNAGPGKATPIFRILHSSQDISSFTVDTKPGLELRTPENRKALLERLEELHDADAATFPSAPGKRTPEVPTVLPPGWTLEDLLGGTLKPVNAREALAAQESWIETLAFYRSPRRANSVSHPWASTDHASDWGIYLHSSGVEMLAREVYLPLGFDHATSLKLATQDLLNHELEHAALDITGLRLEAATGPCKELGRHACSPCLEEEALCHAAVARAARRRVEEAQEAQDAQEARHLQLAAIRLEAWLTAGPPGYCEWAKAKAGEDRQRLTQEVLGHDGVSQIVGLVLYNATERLVLVPDVPVHLVLTPGSAAASGAWQYSR